MLTLGFLGVLVGLVPLVILFALGRVWTLEVAFIRLAWVPVAALALQGMLWRPRLLRSTMLAALPGALLAAYIVVSFVRFFVKS